MQFWTGTFSQPQRLGSASRNTLLMAVVLLAAVSHIHNGSQVLAQDADSSERLVSAETGLACRLVQLGRPAGEVEGNLVTSPAGVFQVLAVLSLAAAGETRAELLGSLGLREQDLDRESPPAASWLRGPAASLNFEYRADVALVENGGYGLRVEKQPDDRSFAQRSGLHQGDLIFRVDGISMRKVEDFQKACRDSAGKVVLEGFEFEQGEVFSEKELELRRFRVPPDPAAAAFQNFNLAVFDGELNPSEKFLKAAEHSFGLQATQLSPLNATGFASAVFKNWFRQVSQGKFGDFSSEFLDLDDARFIVVNLTRLDSAWGAASKPIGPRSFRGFGGETKADFFELEGENFKLVEFDELSFISVPLKATDYQFRLFLPRADGAVGFAAVRERLSDPKVLDKLNSEPAESVALRLFLPRWKVVSELNRSSLKPVLNLKMMFSMAAEFPEFSGNLMAGDFAQRASIVVDSRGVFAEAATGAVMVPKSMPQKYRQLSIDRPFFFQICRNDGLVLFQGQIVEPADSESNKPQE